jgi:DNA-binding transcriptional regulator YiaG
MVLEEYMNEAGISLTKFAALVNKPVSTVHGWKSGRRLPTATDLATIESITDGRVTARDFVSTYKAA